jgi:hypothetical protein
MINRITPKANSTPFQTGQVFPYIEGKQHTKEELCLLELSWRDIPDESNKIMHKFICGELPRINLGNCARKFEQNKEKSRKRLENRIKPIAAKSQNKISLKKVMLSFDQNALNHNLNRIKIRNISPLKAIKQHEQIRIRSNVHVNEMKTVNKSMSVTLF